MAAKTQSVEDMLKNMPGGNPDAALPPHVVATFAGTYFCGGSGEMEAVPYIKDVKVPLGWVTSEEHTPVSLFIQYFAKRVLSDVRGYSGIRTCELKSVNQLPELNLKQRLKWMTDYAEVAKIGSQTSGTYNPLDPEGRQLGRKTVAVKCNLYPSIQALKDAIERCLDEPQAFEQEQEKLSKSKVIEHRSMELELAALGY